MSGDDRSVHGHTPDGRQIVRYDRSGRWYFERPDQRPKRGWRTSVRVNDAAAMAADGTWCQDLPGGQRFDSEVRRFTAAETGFDWLARADELWAAHRGSMREEVAVQKLLDATGEAGVVVTIGMAYDLVRGDRLPSERVR